jgi:hypothetical protein
VGPADTFGGAELSEGLGELVRQLAVRDGGLIRPRRHGRLPPVRKDGSTQGLRLGINPDSHPWADAAHGDPEAR